MSLVRFAQSFSLLSAAHAVRASGDDNASSISEPLLIAQRRRRTCCGILCTRNGAAPSMEGQNEHHIVIHNSDSAAEEAQTVKALNPTLAPAPTRPAAEEESQSQEAPKRCTHYVDLKLSAAEMKSLVRMAKADIQRKPGICISPGDAELPRVRVPKGVAMECQVGTEVYYNGGVHKIEGFYAPDPATPIRINEREATAVPYNKLLVKLRDGTDTRRVRRSDIVRFVLILLNFKFLKLLVIKNKFKF